MTIGPQFGLMLIGALALYMSSFMQERVPQAGRWGGENVVLAHESDFGSEVRIGRLGLSIPERKEGRFWNGNDDPALRKHSSIGLIQNEPGRSLCPTSLSDQESYCEE